MKRCLITTDPETEEVAPLLKVSEPFAHALVLVLSRLPRDARMPFAERFYREREPATTGWITDARQKLAIAAAVALRALELTDRSELRSVRIVDFLEGAAQGDDLSVTPLDALEEIWGVAERVRRDCREEDALDPSCAAAIAIAETLAPSSDTVALQEVLLRVSWAAVSTWEPARVLDFLLDVDRVFRRAGGT